MAASRSDDAPFVAAIDAMTPRDWAELRALVKRIDEYGAPYNLLARQVDNPNGETVVVGYLGESEVVSDTRGFLHNHGLIVPFDWGGWKASRRSK